MSTTPDEYDVFKELYGRKAPPQLSGAFERTMDLFEEAFAEEDTPPLVATSAMLQLAALYRSTVHLNYWQICALRVCLMTPQPEYKLCIWVPHYDLFDASVFMHLDDVETTLTEGIDRVLPLPFAVPGYRGLMDLVGKSNTSATPIADLPPAIGEEPSLLLLDDRKVCTALTQPKGIAALDDFHKYWLDHGCFDVTSVLTNQQHAKAWAAVAAELPRSGRNLKTRVPTAALNEVRDMTAFVKDVLGEES